MRFTRRFLRAFLMLLPLFLMNTANAFGFEYDDDYTPQVTARVARITFLKGDVQIKRAGNENWEVATQNLPLVEGDEITTNTEARLEIQFDSYNHLRLAEKSYLKITTLRDGGIAVSLPQGTLSLRVSEFDKDKTYFEIDAPKTTLAVQQTGMYRVDAGDSTSTEVRVQATEKGEARIYSGNSGFTLKNGRSAKIFLAGDLAGEWETADASRYSDEFDSWTLERDAVIAKRLRDSYYDKYYDRDIYGADDLNEYGEWIYTRNYGYVWKPYANSVSGYSNWSPYRYGHWRWVPPYGWTWVNDESWGWATYHYGRWLWDNGSWYWSPYSYYRTRRSWWNPALVVITYSGGYICWYPLPYQYNYYNYNSYYNNTTIINNNTTVIVNPTPSPSPRQDGIRSLPNLSDIPPSQVVPQNGVVAVNANQFGKDRTGVQTAPVNIAKNVLTNAPVKVPATAILPNYNQLDGKISKTIAAETPRTVKTETPVKTGVIVREAGISVSDKIQKERVLDNRTTDRTNTTVNNGTTTDTTVRDTGAVTRTEQPVKQNTTTQTETERDTTQNPAQTDNTVRSTGGGNTTQTDRNTTRNESNNNTQQTDRNQTQPVRVPQQTQQQTQRNQTQRNESQQTQRNQTQRNEQQPTRQPQQQQQQKQEQKKEEQKPQQEQKQEQKQEEQKPQQQQRRTTQEKDG